MRSDYKHLMSKQWLWLRTPDLLLFSSNNQQLQVDDLEFPLLHIRKLTYESYNSSDTSNLEINLTRGASISLQMSPAKINEFLWSLFREFSQIHILSIESVQHMLNDDRESIMSNITFKDSIYFATCLNANDDDVYLNIYLFTEKSSYIFNVSKSGIPESNYSTAILLTSYLNTFCLYGESIFETDVKNIDQFPEQTQSVEKAIRICCKFFSAHSTNIHQLKSNMINSFVEQSQQQNESWIYHLLFPYSEIIFLIHNIW